MADLDHDVKAQGDHQKKYRQVAHQESLENR
jgi:hypothetical protein